MPILSNFPGAPSVIWSEKHVPFTVYLKFDPVGAKREEKRFSFEKMAAYIEQVLDNICSDSSGEFTFDYTKPVAYTHQFARQTARFSINGHACKRNEFTKTPIGERLVDNDNGYKTGPGAANVSNKVPDQDVLDLATELKNQFESITGLSVIGLRVANFRFGFRKGVHFPL